MHIYYNSKLITRARNMRKEMTPAEKHLWFNCLWISKNCPATPSTEIDRIKTGIVDTRKDKDRNFKFMSAHKAIISQCSLAIRMLMESTSDTSEKDIVYAGKLIDDAVVKHIHPLQKEDIN